MADLTVEVVSGVAEIDREAWDALLVEGRSSPFVEWDFLASLEEADVLGPDKGWVPQFPIVRRGRELVAAAPAYLKAHSQGEFVFDFSWAQLAERLGTTYYPKLLVGVPFTPVTGRRLLTLPGEDREALLEILAGALVKISEAYDLSSIHVNFALEDEVGALCALGFLHRKGLQYHWYRDGDADFDAYLSRFKSKKRNQLKRERREPGIQGITLRTVRDEALETLSPSIMYALYRSTVDKFYWGRRYLNERIFEIWRERLRHRMEVVIAEREDGTVVAGTINFQKNDRLYGRYWGSFQDLRHLHFNVCYYHAIEECLGRGLDVFEPGAGGEHKLVRGFRPTVMNSAHLLLNQQMYQIVANHLETERRHVEREREAMLAMGG